MAVVRSYMAHHQGMTLVALGNVVHDGSTRRRFHAHPMVQAAELLLQERTPRSVAVTRPRGEEVRVAPLVRDLVLPTLRRFESPHDITPRTHLLSNGRYTVMITAAGSGFSRWEDLAVTRWREDTTRDCWGTFAFLRDADSGDVWSAGFQPSGTEVDHYEVVYSEDRAKIVQRDRSLSITLEIVVSPEDDAELRQLTVTNLGDRDREIDFTSYAEVVLAPQGADEAHPAFSNLFVETEFVPELGTLLATRRPRSADEPEVWLAHVVAVEGEPALQLQHETDRARFLGRGRGIRTPLSVFDGRPLSDTTGAVLDPDREPPDAAGDSARRNRPSSCSPRSWQGLGTRLSRSRRSTVSRRRSSARARWPGRRRRSSCITYGSPRTRRISSNVWPIVCSTPIPRCAQRHRSWRATAAARPGLWPYGISGDLPIASCSIERDEERDVVRQLLRAQEYWRMKGIAADLVILNATVPPTRRRCSNPSKR